jgi:hypothetical protein
VLTAPRGDADEPELEHGFSATRRAQGKNIKVPMPGGRLPEREVGGSAWLCGCGGAEAAAP